MPLEVRVIGIENEDISAFGKKRKIGIATQLQRAFGYGPYLKCKTTDLRLQLLLDGDGDDATATATATVTESRMTDDAADGPDCTYEDDTWVHVNTHGTHFYSSKVCLFAIDCRRAKAKVKGEHYQYVFWCASKCVCVSMYSAMRTSHCMSSAIITLLRSTLI